MGIRKEAMLGKPASPAERLIVALDTPDLDAALALAGKLKGSVGLAKVGLELYTAEGPRAIFEIRRLGLSIFLDLKLHDIPNTVRSAARAASRHGVKLLTVHAGGGSAMIAAAVEGAKEGAIDGCPPPHILAVTVLTSMDAKALIEVGMMGTPKESVLRLAEMAVKAGAGGLVCSPEEALSLRSLVGDGPLIVTPGIRPSGAGLDDQARVATPAAAIGAGADYLVIGRPIRNAPDPKAAADALIEEISSSCA